MIFVKMKKQKRNQPKRTHTICLSLVVIFIIIKYYKYITHIHTIVTFRLKANNNKKSMFRRVINDYFFIKYFKLN